MNVRDINGVLVVGGGTVGTGDGAVAGTARGARTGLESAPELVKEYRSTPCRCSPSAGRPTTLGWLSCLEAPDGLILY